MTLKEAACAIGAEETDAIPGGMFAYYPVPEARKQETCSRDMIERLQEKFDFFGQYFEAVRERWRALEQDPIKKAYLDAAGLFMKDGAYGEVNGIKGPAPGTDPADDLFLLFVFLPVIEKAYDEYIFRGFSADEALREIRVFYRFLDRASGGDGKHPVFDRRYFSWLCHAAKSLIFHPAGYEFELHKAHSVFILRHKRSGAVLPLAHGVTLHRSGMILGSSGYGDGEGALEANVEESEDAFTGYPAKDGYFLTEKRSFPKSEWTIALKDGDDCIGCHIPRGADITRDAFCHARASALQLVRERYPDWRPKMFVCGSWLLSPELEKILREDSRIVRFGRTFVRYPQQDASGSNAFYCIFPDGSQSDPDALPENTGLCRAAKQIYRAGDVIHSFYGVIPLDSL